MTDGWFQGRFSWSDEGIAIFLVFVFLVVISALFLSLFGGWTSFEFLEIATFGVNGFFSLFLFAYFVVRRPISFATFAWFFVVLFLFLVPCAQYLTDHWRYSTTSMGMVSGAVWKTNLLIFASYSSFLVSYLLMSRRGEKKAATSKPSVYVIDPVGFAVLFGLLLALAAVYMAQLGSVRAILLRGAMAEAAGFTTEQSDLKATTQFMRTIVRPGYLMMAIAALCLPVWYRGKILVRDAVHWSSWTIAILGVAVIVNLPIAVGRFYLLSMCFVFLTIIFWKSRWTGVVILGFLIAGPMTSSFINVFRVITFDSALSISDIFQFDVGYFFLGHFNSYETIVQHIGWIAEDGLVWGKTLVSPFTFWVPRSLWADKPLSSSYNFVASFLGPQIGFPMRGVGTSPIAAFVQNFGVLGTLLCGGLAGGYSGYMDGFFRRLAQSAMTRLELVRRFFPVVTIYPILLGASLAIHRGGIDTAVQAIVGYSFAYFLCRLTFLRRVSMAGNSKSAVSCQ